MAMDIGNQWTVNDYLNAKTAWIAAQSRNHRQVRVYKFEEFEVRGNQVNQGTNVINPNESYRVPLFNARIDHVWASMVKVFDTVKGGYFTTGDLDVFSEYILQGYSTAYTTPDGVEIPEYAGDMIEWNGKLWEVADQMEPIQWGYQANSVFYRTVMRRTQRTNIGITSGPR